MKVGETKEIHTERLFLISLINKSGEAFLRDNPFLDKLENGDLSKEEWRQFATQRYLAALPFKRLLKACEEAATKAGDSQLAEVVDDNLKDETGVDANGDFHTDLSHAEWRKDFYHALGIDDASLESASATEGTKEYEASLEGLIEKDDPVVMAGALLALEGTIPREFSRMKRGRDVTFPDAFVAQESDSNEERAQKARARLYLDDHITHDAQAHYPSLLGALEKYAASDSGRKKIEIGVQMITAAKKRFYQDWK